MSDRGAEGRVVERFVSFDCAGDACIGVLSLPASGAGGSRLGVVIVVGGPQYRAGSHRQFVLAARAIAAAGFPAFRFDYRGMGDSGGAPRTFEDVHQDIAAAASTLRNEAPVDRVVLWGLCDGASAAFLYAPTDPSVAGIVALNPWARSEATLASTRLRHYYVDRVLSRAFWSKLLSGGVEVGAALGEAARAVGAASVPKGARRPGFLSRMHAAWSAFRRPVLLVLSGRDYTAREFEAWIDADPHRRAWLESELSYVVHLGDADHTFSSRAVLEGANDHVVAWLGRLNAP